MISQTPAIPDRFFALALQAVGLTMHFLPGDAKPTRKFSPLRGERLSLCLINGRLSLGSTQWRDKRSHPLCNRFHFERGSEMCDYSLCGLPNRLAVEGETVEAFRFPSGSMGLVSVRELHGEPATQPPRWNFWSVTRDFIRNLSRPVRRPMVVCVPPGAELVFRDIPASFRQLHGVAAEECVRFTQTSFAVHTYRDAIRFGNGVTVLLQELPEGLRGEVLSLNGDFSGWQPQLSEAEPRTSSGRRQHSRAGA